MIFDILFKIFINLSVVLGSGYGLGSGVAIDYGSILDFFLGLGVSGILELILVISFFDVIVNLFGSVISNVEKEIDSEWSSSVFLSGEGLFLYYYKIGKNRNWILDSGDYFNENRFLDESEEKE